MLWRDGPHTEGVFRRAGNARCLKEIKEQLNNGLEADLQTKPVILLADLLKVTYFIYLFTDRDKLKENLKHLPKNAFIY